MRESVIDRYGLRVVGATAAIAVAVLLWCGVTTTHTERTSMVGATTQVSVAEVMPHHHIWHVAANRSKIVHYCPGCGTTWMQPRQLNK